ncbi:MAG: hypothetical protein EZS28_036190, partial [Streblomastix strix]
MPKVYGSENAQFKMTDYSWLNSRKYIYGILASNDGVHFSGTDGILDQEGVEIEVEVVDGEQFVNFARFKLAKWQAWLIPPVYDGRKQRMAKIKRKHQLKLVKEEKYRQKIEQQQSIKQQENGINHEDVADTVEETNQEALPIDFSWLQPGCVELQGVNWGEQGPPETLGLASQGIISPTQEMINKQSEQENVFKPMGQNNEQLRLQMISPVGQMLLSTKMKSPIRNIGSN